MFCPQCGTSLVEGVRFCHHCGCRLADFIPELAEKDKAGPEPTPPKARAPAAKPAEPKEELPLAEEEAPAVKPTEPQEKPAPLEAEAPAVAQVEPVEEPPPAEQEAPVIAPAKPEEKPTPVAAEAPAAVQVEPVEEPPPAAQEAPAVTTVEPMPEPPAAEAEALAVSRAEPVREPPPATAHVPAEAPVTRRQPAILVDESHKERTNDPNWIEFKKRLKERGKVSVRAQKPLSKALLRGKDILVVGGPEHPWVFGRGADRWDSDEVAAIEQFVAQGGALFVMGDGMANAEAVSALTAPFGITFHKDDVGDVIVEREDISLHPLTAGVGSLRLGSVLGIGGLYLQVEEPAVVLARHNGRPVLAHCVHAGGQVVALSSLSAFSDKFIDRGDNAVLLDNILRHLLRSEPSGQEPPAPGKAARKARSAPKKAPEAGGTTLAEAEPMEKPAERSGAATGLAARLARAREMAAPLQETLTTKAKEVASSVQETVTAKMEEVGQPGAESVVARAKQVAASVGEAVSATAEQLAGTEPESLVARAKERAATVQAAVTAKAQEAVTAPEAEQAVSAQAEPGRVEARRAPARWELWLNLFGEEDTQFTFDFGQHLQHFAQGLPPLAREEGAADHVRSLAKPEDDLWMYDLPFTEAEPWSASNYLRRLLYHLTQGRISYFIDPETRRRQGGYYRMAILPAVANMNQQRLEARHPITLTEESLLGEWIVAITPHFGGIGGGMYLTTHRFLLVADQAMLARDEVKTPPLPYLSFWAKVDFRTVLGVLGAEGLPLWVEKRAKPLPKRLARRMWFEPIESWQADRNLEVMAISAWDMDLVLVEGRRGGDGIHQPTPEQAWAFFGYRLTKTNGRQDFVAMVPPLILPRKKQVLKGIRGDFQFLQSKHEATDALDLIAFAKIARDNALLHSPELVSWPVPLQEAPDPI